MKNILKKLHSVKKEMDGLKKTNSNPFFKSKYFDINDILLHIEPLLQKNNLVLIQPIMDNKVCSQIYDIESGEFVESKIDLSDIKDPQKKGSEISYFRRYTLQSLLSLQALDDDGQQASKPQATSENIEKAVKGGYNLEQIEGKYSVNNEMKALYKELNKTK